MTVSTNYCAGTTILPPASLAKVTMSGHTALCLPQRRPVGLIPLVRARIGLADITRRSTFSRGRQIFFGVFDRKLRGVSSLRCGEAIFTIFVLKAKKRNFKRDLENMSSEFGVLAL